MPGDGHVVELLAELRVLQGAVVAGHGGADGSPGDAVARLVEAAERRAESLGAGQQAVGGNADVLQREAGGDGGAQRPLAVHVGGLEAGGVGGDDEAADTVVFVGRWPIPPSFGGVGFFGRGTTTLVSYTKRPTREKPERKD